MPMDFEDSKKEIKIVPPVKEEGLSIAKVLYDTWLTTYPNEELGITRDDIEFVFKDRFTKENLEKRWDKLEKSINTKMLVAKYGSEIVGLITVTLHEDKNQLQAIYILPEYQGRGIGVMLWGEAQKYLDPKKKTIVQCATYNTGAIAFYEKLGFKDNGRRWEDEKLRMQSGSIIPQMEMELEAR